MTPSDTLREQQLARQRAGQDIADIEFLAKCEPFQRYWVRRLREKHADINQKFHYNEASPEQREAWRQQLLAYEELRDVAAKDRAVCQRAIEAPMPVPGQSPMQAN